MPLRLGSALSVESIRRDLEALAELSDADFNALSSMLREADATLDRDSFHERLHERLPTATIPQAERASNVLVFLLSESATRGLTSSELQEDIAQLGLSEDQVRSVQDRLQKLFELREHIRRFSSASDAANEGLPNFTHASVALDLRLAYPHAHADEVRELGQGSFKLAGVEPVLIVTIETDSEGSFTFQANRTQLRDLNTLLTMWTERMTKIEDSTAEIAALLERRMK